MSTKIKHREFKQTDIIALNMTLQSEIKDDNKYAITTLERR